MSLLIFILVVLVILGLALYAVRLLAPIDEVIKNLISVVMVLIAIVVICHRANLI